MIKAYVSPGFVWLCVLCLQQLARVKLDVRRHEDVIKEKRQFLENEIENNTEQEKKISTAERTSAKLRLDFNEAETARIQFHDEVDVCLIHFSFLSLAYLLTTLSPLPLPFLNLYLHLFI